MKGKPSLAVLALTLVAACHGTTTRRGARAMCSVSTTVGVYGAVPGGVGVGWWSPTDDEGSTYEGDEPTTDDTATDDDGTDDSSDPPPDDGTDDSSDPPPDDGADDSGDPPPDDGSSEPQSLRPKTYLGAGCYACSVTCAVTGDTTVQAVRMSAFSPFSTDDACLSAHTRLGDYTRVSLGRELSACSESR